MILSNKNAKGKQNLDQLSTLDLGLLNPATLSLKVPIGVPANKTISPEPKQPLALLPV